jgi:hypothetical protein
MFVKDFARIRHNLAKSHCRKCAGVLKAERKSPGPRKQIKKI